MKYTIFIIIGIILFILLNSNDGFSVGIPEFLLTIKDGIISINTTIYSDDPDIWNTNESNKVFEINENRYYVYGNDIDDARSNFDVYIASRQSAAGGAAGGGACSVVTSGDTFLEKIKNALITITGSEWSEESLPISQQMCIGNNTYFYQCYLDRLIEALPELNLQKDKFFWINGTGHSYIIYDEDGEIGNYINISPNDSVSNQPDHNENPENWEKRIIIDKSQNFIGYVKDGFKPIETWDSMSNIIYYDGVTRMKFADTYNFTLDTIDCSKPFYCKR